MVQKTALDFSLADVSSWGGNKVTKVTKAPASTILTGIETPDKAG